MARNGYFQVTLTYDSGMVVEKPMTGEQLRADFYPEFKVFVEAWYAGHRNLREVVHHYDDWRISVRKLTFSDYLLVRYQVPLGDGVESQ